MSARDTSTTPGNENSMRKATNTAMIDFLNLFAPSKPSDAYLEGDFILFPKLPASVRNRIWKYSLPSGRLVDIVFDKEQDRYFSFHAIIPAVLHTSKESRAVGLRFYSLCFGTKSHAASIPFDFGVDCLMFDDWLAPRTSTKNGPPPTCASELARIIGPMGAVKQQHIHRLAIPIDFFTCFPHEQFVEGLRHLFNKFPAADYLVFVFESRNPYDTNFISFWNFEIDHWCCEDCLIHIKTGVPRSIEEALVQPDEEANDGERQCQKVQHRFRGVTRFGEDSHTMMELWDCPYDTKEEDSEEEYPQYDRSENEDDADVEKYTELEEPEVVKEDFGNEELEYGELEGLLLEGIFSRKVCKSPITREHSAAR
jgi:hypothetical protein